MIKATNINYRISKFSNFVVERLLSKGIFFWLGVITISIFFKTLFFPVKLGDYNTYLDPWVRFISENGYFDSLKFNFYNYTPAYIYILILIAKTGINSLYMIKIVSVLFEFILAYFAGKILLLKYKNKLIFWICFSLLPLIPSIFINGALWGQCDAIYTTFVVAGIYYSLINRQLTATTLLAIAISFKIQAVFILPYFFILLLFGKIKWYYFFLIPIVYFLSVLPAWLYGRELTDLFSIYLNQSDYYESLTMFMPNIYVWIQDADYKTFKIVGIVLTTLFITFAGIYLKIKKINLNNENLILIGFASVIITPFILPGMHERYLYVADILSLIYIFWFKDNIHIPIAMWSVSLYAYISCSRFKEFLPLWPAFFVYLLAIILIFRQIKFKIKA